MKRKTVLRFSLVNSLKDQGGASITMVLMISAMVSVIGVGVVKLSQLLVKAEKQTAITREADDVAFYAMTTFRDPRACQNTFQGVDPAKDTIDDGEYVPSIKDSNLPTPNVLISQNQVLGRGTKGRLTLRKITLTGYPLTSPEVTGPPVIPESDNNAQVFLIFEKKVGNNISTFNRRFLIKVTLDSDSKVDKCYYERDAVDTIIPTRKTYTNPNLGVKASEEGCESLGGILDKAEGKCRNLTLENDNSISGPYNPFPAGPFFPTYFGENDSHNYALKSSGKMRITNSLYLNKDPASVDALTGLSDDKGDIIGSGNLSIDLNTTVTRSMGIGIAAPGVSGTAHFNVAAIVGPGVPPGKGLFITKYLGVGASSTPVVSPSVVVATVKLDGELTVGASTLASGANSIRTLEGIQIQTTQVGASLDDDDAVTRAYYQEHISKALGMDPTIVNEISGYLVSTQQGRTYDTIRDAVCRSLKIDGNNLGACSWTSSYSISNPSNNLRVNIGTKSSTVQVPHCGRTGECNQVCVDGKCFTSFSGRFCPYRKVMVGVTSTGSPICALDKAEGGGAF